MRTIRSASRPLALLGLLACLQTGTARADDLFDVTSFPHKGRVVAAELADLNGDGRGDLLEATLVGIPPAERRQVRVRIQDENGVLPSEPNWTIALPSGSSAYDMADLRETPGVEMVLLRQDRVTVLSLGTAEGRRWDLPLPGASSVGSGADERGLERFRLVWDGFGDEPWIWVPQLSAMTALAPDGRVMAQIAVEGRSNYFIPPRPGLVFNESDIQLFYDAPRLSMGDVDGDGRVDLVTSSRHELRVFLRREDGSYPGQPDRRIALGMVSERDHIRGSGGIASDPRDLDGDGSLDLMISQVTGAFTDATMRTTTYMNREGGWKLPSPDTLFESDSTIGTDVLLDVDGDRRYELLRIQLSFSLLEMIEALLTQEVDAEVALYRLQGGRYGEDPWVRRKVEMAWSFDTFRPEGFLPTFFCDLNDDGQLDFVASGEGESFEVYLGGGNRPYMKRTARQKMDTSGQLRFGHLDGDRLEDFVLFDPHNFDVATRVGRNLGALPGTPPALEAGGRR